MEDTGRLISIGRDWKTRALRVGLFALYLLLVATTILRHEAWTDEAQAWLLARDSSLFQLLFHQLHYEGTPGLWHLLLWLLARLHLPYASMHWLSGAAGAAATFLLLYRSPFPALVRWLLPFSVGLAYQAPVVARSYSLVPVLVFGLCALWNSKQRRPLLAALLAGLLANTSLIALALALGLAPLYLWRQRTLRKRTWLAGALLAACVLFAIATALPAPDVVSPARRMNFSPHVTHLLQRATGIGAVCTSAQPECAQPAGSAEPCHPASPNSVRRVPSWINFASLALFPVAGNNLLGGAFYLLFLCWLWRRGTLMAALPLLATLAAAKLLPFNEHHMLVVWTAILCSLWLAYSLRPAEKNLFEGLWTAVLLLVLVQQVAWTAFAAGYDWREPFDGGAAAARFIETHAQNASWAAFNYHAVDAQPYAAQNPFVNWPTSYWTWSCTGEARLELAKTLDRRPRYILLGESYDGNVSWRNQIVAAKSSWQRNDEDGLGEILFRHGYRPTQRFCGRQPMHFGFSEQSCEVVFEPKAQSTATM